MRLDIDFSDLWKEVERITRNRSEFVPELNRAQREPIDLALEQGKEIPLEDVDFSGPVASVQGRQVLLYIPDHRLNFDAAIEDPEKGRKFHVTWCKTLEDMQRKKRFERYFATNNLSGLFTISGLRNSTTPDEADVELMVCKNCLDKLNYKGAARGQGIRKTVAVEFKIPEFFETYSSCFRYMPSGLSKPGNQDYSKDWADVSRSKKERVGYKCESCEVELRDAARLLHSHHRNGLKSDNSDSNLMALCADCHRNQPAHEHMHVPHSDTQLINRLRRQQNIKPNDWDQVEELVDPAVRWRLDEMRMKGWEAPEIGYEAVDAEGAVIAEFEAAWPNRKYALVVNESDKVKFPPWRIDTIGEATRLA
jgi:hypothetical protein